MRKCLFLCACSLLASCASFPPPTKIQIVETYCHDALGDARLLAITGPILDVRPKQAITVTHGLAPWRMQQHRRVLDVVGEFGRAEVDAVLRRRGHEWVATVRDVKADQGTTTIKGQLLGFDNLPLRQGTVTMLPPSGRLDEGKALVCEIDRNGFFLFPAVPRPEGLRRESRILMTDVPGHGRHFHRAALVSTEHDVTLKVGREARLSGQLLDEKGRPLAGVAIDLDHYYNGHDQVHHWVGEYLLENVDPPAPLYETTTDEYGRFYLEGLEERSEVWVVARKDGYTTQIKVARPPEHVEISMGR